MNCQGIGRILGHKYEARYDTTPTGWNVNARSISPQDVLAIIDANSVKTYRGDVCTRCGHIVNAPKEQP